VVELAVQHAGAGAHALHVAGQDDAGVCAAGRAVAHAVLVRQRAVEHITDDLHVAMAVRAEAGARRDAVVVDDAQVAHAHVARVVVVGEREAVETLQPAVVGITAVGGLAQRQHRQSP
jgi:Arc/MetJ family transcription regulator